MIGKKMIKKLKRQGLARLNIKKNFTGNSYFWLDWTEELKKTALFNSNLIVMQTS